MVANVTKARVFNVRIDSTGDMQGMAKDSNYKQTKLHSERRTGTK